MYKVLKNKILLIISDWGYPFGGGEEYLYQTAIWVKKYGMRSYWLCFFNSDNKPYEQLIIKEVDGFFILEIPGGFNKDILYNWILLINPDIIHHQGNHRKYFYDICSLLKIYFITGIHFWNGIINLSSETKNINIYENFEKHKVSDEFLELYNAPYCIFYTVSEYVYDCIKKITNKQIENIVYSGSLKEKCYVNNNNPENNKYVTIINIHKMKGGELVLYLLQELKQIPFLIIRTEPYSIDLDNKIFNIINERNNDGISAKSIFMERTNEIKLIYSQTKLLLAPSIVDETFCRTVNEAMMNGIPIITSGQGNLKYLVNSSSIILPLRAYPISFNLYEEDMKNWKNMVYGLYYDNDRLKRISKKILIKYNDYSEEKCKNMFMNLLYKTLLKSKEYNIAIIAPWCDQGLGIQARNYYNILCQENYNVHIFSFKPYNANSAIDMQKDPNEWIVDNIYYSSNDREHITDSELLEFINKYNIGKCILPETCWFRIFEIAELLKKHNIKLYAIPNIEIVRKDEMEKHKLFYKILCNNILCYNIFNKHNIDTIEYIGYGIFNDKSIFRYKKINKIIKFLFIGGMNAFSRKHIIEICEGFSFAYNENKNISLTCTIQQTNLLESEDISKLNQYFKHPGIKFINNHQKYKDIMNLYYNHHISIQVSKHEGLGLGFFEALASGTPIITLDTPPHNEIIREKINGWLIPCYYKKMTDNNNSFIESAYFDPKLLCDKILSICNNKDSLMCIFKKLLLDFNSRLSCLSFTNRFINAIN